MKEISTILFSFLIASNILGQAQTTFVKSFKLNGSDYLMLNLDGDVEVKEWKDGFLRIHTNVASDNATSEALKFFSRQGRYNLRPSLQGDGSLAISSVDRPINVKYRGQDLSEKVSYTVFIPENVGVEVNGKEVETSANMYGDGKE